ncbi:MAG: TetR/AcrR family transcriptional regulator [Micromonosporaceae bacterium]
MTRSTRERIIGEALRLFAEKGYSATAVAEIEAASGLSPGAGGLYRHFRSKEEVLAAAIRAHAARTTDQIDETLRSATSTQLASLPDRLRYLCKLGLAKMTEEANLIRVIFRDLDQFPHLVDEFREALVQPLYEVMITWGRQQPEFAGADVDWPAVAAVLGGAVVNYWLTTTQLGAPPGRVEEPRFVAAWTRLALGLLPGCKASAPPQAVASPIG